MHVNIRWKMARAPKGNEKLDIDEPTAAPRPETQQAEEVLRSPGLLLDDAMCCIKNEIATMLFHWNTDSIVNIDKANLYIRCRSPTDSTRVLFNVAYRVEYNST